MLARQRDARLAITIQGWFQRPGRTQARSCEVRTQAVHPSERPAADLSVDHEHGQRRQPHPRPLKASHKPKPPAALLGVGHTCCKQCQPITRSSTLTHRETRGRRSWRVGMIHVRTARSCDHLSVLQAGVSLRFEYCPCHPGSCRLMGLGGVYVQTILRDPSTIRAYTTARQYYYADDNKSVVWTCKDRQVIPTGVTRHICLDSMICDVTCSLDPVHGFSEHPHEELEHRMCLS